MEGGRFLPPEVGSKIKEKAELTPQEKEILKKVSFQILSVKYIVTSMVGQQKESSRFKQGVPVPRTFAGFFSGFRIRIGSVFSNFVDPDPYSKYGSGSTQLRN